MGETVMVGTSVGESVAVNIGARVGSGVDVSTGRLAVAGAGAHPTKSVKITVIKKIFFIRFHR